MRRQRGIERLVFRAGGGLPHRSARSRAGGTGQTPGRLPPTHPGRPTPVPSRRYVRSAGNVRAEDAKGAARGVAQRATWAAALIGLLILVIALVGWLVIAEALAPAGQHDHGGTRQCRVPWEGLCHRVRRLRAVFRISPRKEIEYHRRLEESPLGPPGETAARPLPRAGRASTGQRDLPQLPGQRLFDGRSQGQRTARPGDTTNLPCGLIRSFPRRWRIWGFWPIGPGSSTRPKSSSSVTWPPSRATPRAGSTLACSTLTDCRQTPPTVGRPRMRNMPCGRRSRSSPVRCGVQGLGQTFGCRRPQAGSPRLLSAVPGHRLRPARRAAAGRTAGVGIGGSRLPGGAGRLENAKYAPGRPERTAAHRCDATARPEQFSQAEVACLKWTQQEPNNPLAWSLLGRACQEQGHAEDARRALERMAALLKKDNR